MLATSLDRTAISIGKICSSNFSTLSIQSSRDVHKLKYGTIWVAIYYKNIVGM